MLMTKEKIGTKRKNRFLLVNYNVAVLKLLFFQKLKIVSEYNQEIPQSQTADNPVAARGRAAQPS